MPRPTDGQVLNALNRAEFAAWMQGRGLDDKAAAPLLAAARPEVTRWRNGVRPVPRRVVRIIQLLPDPSA